MLLELSRALGIEYRLQDGEIQMRFPGTEWDRSAHDDALLRDAVMYEQMGAFDLAELIRQKFAAQEAK